MMDDVVDLDNDSCGSSALLVVAFLVRYWLAVESFSYQHGFRQLCNMKIEPVSYKTETFLVIDSHFLMLYWAI